MAAVLSSAMMASGVYRYESDRRSHEFFSPGPLSRERTATAASAVFNLVKTIIGGGILSLPFAFDKCGLALSVVFMVISAAASTFTLYVIVSCSRRGGAATYEEVVRKALGPRAAVVTVVLLVMLTFLTLVAYVIFIKDLVGSLGARYLFAHALSAAEQNGLTIACVALISPFLFVRSMDALRFTSIFSLIAVVVLAIVITIRAIESLSPAADAVPYEEASPVSIKMVPTSWKDAVYAFPIISVSYLCHFNVLPVYRELHKPTRHRLKKIVASTMFSTWVFYMIVGTMGYLFAYRMPGGVQGDILNNFSDSDKLVNLGRLGLLVTILLSLPIICQPCRSNLERLIKYVVDYSKPAIAAVIEKNSGRETEPLLPAISRRSTPSPSSALSDSSDESPSGRSRFSRENITYVGLTVAIMVSATACALLSPGVVVVWNLMGSTVGILISYVLPCASYVRIRAQKPNSDKRKLAAWIILAVSSVVCVACSVQSISSIFA